MNQKLLLNREQQGLSFLQFQPQQQQFITKSSNLIYNSDKNSLIYYGYSKAKISQQKSEQGQSAGTQQSKPKKKFTFKVGKDKETKPVNETITKVNIFQIEQNKWSKKEVKGKVPPARQGQQVMMLNQNSLLLYGGKNLENQKLLNDLHVLNLQTLTWKKLFSIQGPPSSQNNVIIRISETKILLVNLRQIWTFQSKEVKWELNTNELPGGIWSNLLFSFQNIIDVSKQKIVSAINISLDHLNNQSQKILVFTSSSEEKHSLNSYIINLKEKDIQKTKLMGELNVNAQNIQKQFSCFQLQSKNKNSSTKSFIVKVKDKQKIIIFLSYFDEDTCSIERIDKEQLEIKVSDSQQALLGKCFDSGNGFLYQIYSNPQNPKRKDLRRLSIKTQQIQISGIQSDNKERKQSSNYMNTSVIQSIPEQSNESSMIGVKSSNYQNQRQQQFFQVQSQVYNMGVSQQKKFIQSSRNSQVNRSSSAQSNQISSQIQIQNSPHRKTDQNHTNKVHNASILNHSQENIYDSSIYTHVHNNSQGQQFQQPPSSYERNLESTLKRLLVFQHIKRKKLQQKSNILQIAIKKAQNLSRMLTKYASANEKNRHIQQVKYLKQQLETIWNKEIFFRRQIDYHSASNEPENSSKGSIGRQNQHRIKRSETSSENRGKIDMNKLLRVHNVLIKE